MTKELIDDREAIAKALCEGADTCWDDLTEQELVWHYRDAESVLAAGFSRGPVPDAATDAKQPEGWSTEDRREAKCEAERRWSRPVAREAEQRYQAGNINGFMLGAEWQKARETFISYKVIADEARAERDAALAAVDAARAIHTVKHGERPRYAADDYHAEREPVSWEKYSMCEGCSATWPCPTVAALDGAPEPEPLPVEGESKP